jgi:hypothetical protein
MPHIYGETRTRSQLHGIYGGPNQGFIITIGPVVKAVLVMETINPEAPEIIRAGDGLKRSAWKARLREYGGSFDVWIRKRDESVYTFVGRYRFLSEDAGVQRTEDLEITDPLRKYATTYTTIRLCPE